MRTSAFFLVFLLLSGCRTKDTEVTDSAGTITTTDSGLTTGIVDADDDGSPEGEDCDDSDPSATPGGTETPYDGVDNDCDETTPDDDLDGDGYPLADDCNDEDAAVNPGAVEQCNDVDDDCNNLVDDAAGDLWYADADGDGFGDVSTETTSCDGDEGLVADASDCDDTVATVNPDATEICNGIDDDCDLLTDDDDPDLDGADTWYRDGDGDGFGDDASALTACTAPEAHVADGGDCDDTDAAVNPDAAELCNTLDDDCDGLIDDDDDSVTDQTVWYLDSDSDGYGTTAYSVTACDEPSGFADNADDCDDGDSGTWPGANESCDGDDNDCDSAVDENASDAGVWYADADGDGYGDVDSPSASCEAGSNTVADATDCDDGDSSVHPGATELCNGADDDCDTLVDDDDPDVADASTWYADADSDGFGDPAAPTVACDAPSKTVADDTDCDDGDSAVNPDASEICNSTDDDCDGLVDDDDPDISDASTWYLDVDGDGYGSADFSVDACSAPSSYVADDTDCDDAHADANPAGTETCDGLDNDCSGDIDEGFDADGDGYQDESCPTGDDCDDSDAAVNPGAAELCAVGDEDCDGLDGDDDPDVSDPGTWYLDYDGDGYGTADFSADACDAPSGYVDNADDCEDASADANPAGTEICDGLDNDCSGDVDEGFDADGDGFQDESCPDGDDCDDLDSAVNPDAAELCAAGDEDCDGLDGDDDPDVSDPTTWNLDYDGDGYGGSSITLDACDQPAGYGQDSDDCDDLDSAVNPGATEACNGFDDDCDGLVDGDDPDLPGGSLATYYTDADGDGYGDPDDSTDACEAPSGTVENADDCDDTSAEASPDGIETCDGLDNDCNGTTDDDAEVLGTGPDCPALDCVDVQANGSSGSSDGNAWIDPLGEGSYEVFCDQTNEGGGWTLVANVDDVSDPYFGAQQSEPWETDSVRNETTLPSHTADISLTTKYASWGDVDVTDVYIVYKNTSQYFLCEGLSVNDPLADIFALTPATGACSAECTSYSEDIMPEASTTPVGLNCNDPNEGWMEAGSAENARIGALSNEHSCCVFNAWLGAAGDRGFATSNLEKTWGAYSSGAEYDDNIMVFVR